MLTVFVATAPAAYGCITHKAFRPAGQRPSERGFAGLARIWNQLEIRPQWLTLCRPS